MKRLLASAFAVLGSVLVSLAACTEGETDFSGKRCALASDCPEGYACVTASAEVGRSCERFTPPATSDAGAGPVPTYCADIQPILAASCVSTCHGAVQSGSGVTTFRLDYYEPDAGGLPGARAKADRIKARAYDFPSMPPAGSDVPVPTSAERALLARWAAGGAPFCSDGGIPEDAGTPDGGGDGGS